MEVVGRSVDLTNPRPLATEVRSIFARQELANRKPSGHGGRLGTTRSKHGSQFLLEKRHGIHFFSHDFFCQLPWRAKPSFYRRNFAQPTRALKSGDLACARSACATPTQTGDGSNPNIPVAAALQQIGSALQSGDIGQAQLAIASWDQQMQGTRGHHHHGHHRVDNACGNQELDAGQRIYWNGGRAKAWRRRVCGRISCCVRDP